MMLAILWASPCSAYSWVANGMTGAAYQRARFCSYQLAAACDAEPGSEDQGKIEWCLRHGASPSYINEVSVYAALLCGTKGRSM